MSVPWTAHLKNALLRALTDEWCQQNYSAFGDAMRPPVFTFSDSTERLGQWHPKPRTLTLSRSLVTTAPWVEVIEVLRHEMAHQYVHEILRVHDETAHGPAFRWVCAERAIDAAAAGLPSGAPVAEDKLVRRIRHLLALADSPNQHEAEAAARKAYALMMAHNVAWAERAETPRFVVRHLGPTRKRFPAHESALVGILGKHFFISVLFVQAYDVASDTLGNTVEISGTLENVQMAEHVYHWLLQTGERLWITYRRDHNLKGNAERRRFLLGLFYGFRDQLDRQRVACAQTGLVWRGDPQLDDFRSRRHPRTQRRSGGSYQPTEAFHAGRAQGADLRLNRPIHGTSGGPTRLITGD